MYFICFFDVFMYTLHILLDSKFPLHLALIGDKSCCCWYFWRLTANVKRDLVRSIFDWTNGHSIVDNAWMCRCVCVHSWVETRRDDMQMTNFNLEKPLLFWFVGYGYMSIVIYWYYHIRSDARLAIQYCNGMIGVSCVIKLPKIWRRRNSENSRFACWNLCTAWRYPWGL